MLSILMIELYCKNHTLDNCMTGSYMWIYLLRYMFGYFIKLLSSFAQCIIWGCNLLFPLIRACMTLLIVPVPPDSANILQVSLLPNFCTKG